MRDLRVVDFHDRPYYHGAGQDRPCPSRLQSLIFNGLALVDNVMIGGMGDAAISAVGIANKLSFVYMLFMFGVHSGANMFCAQFWGKGDLSAVRKVLGISIRMCLVALLPFLFVSQFLPGPFMTFFIRDPQVVSQGGRLPAHHGLELRLPGHHLGLRHPEPGRGPHPAAVLRQAPWPWGSTRS